MDEEENDDVLDFSSGSAKAVKNTATKVKVVSEKETKNAGGKAFSQFRDLIDLVNITKELEAAGNVTIFSPTNQAFEKLSTKVENIDVSILRKWALKHFMKGYQYKRDIKSGPVQTLGGEWITVIKNKTNNKMKIFSNSGVSKVLISNIKLKFGLVHVIDTLLT